MLSDIDDSDIRDALDLLTGWCRNMPLAERVEGAIAILNGILERDINLNQVNI